MNSHDYQEFNAVVEKEGDFSFVSIHFSPRDVWGAKPRFSVSGTINDIPVHGTLGALGKNYVLRLSKTWLKDSKIETGAMVTIKLSIEEPRLGS